MNAVIFDLGSVVFEWEPRRFVARALEINRIFDDVDHWLMAIFQDQATSCDWVAFDRGVASIEFLSAQIAGRLSQKDPACGRTVGQVTQVLHSIAYQLVPITATANLLHDLHNLQSCNLFFLSNMPKEFARLLQDRFPESFDVFSLGVFSYEFGCLKPENELYMAAAERFRLNRFNRVIFVDDQPLNIVAAERLGWIGVQFTNACFVRQQLKQIIGS